MKSLSIKKVSTYLLTISMLLFSFSLVVAVSPTATAAPEIIGLTAPAMIVATAEDSQINLTWSPVTGATYYNVYQSIDDLTYNLIASTPMANYNVQGLTNGILYYFKTTATNTVLESTYSNLASGTPLARINPVNLGTAGDYAILSKTRISTVPNSVITGRAVNYTECIPETLVAKH
ncbi:hypothetical protein G9F72_010180 [Clostridium estertheticum]|uniref:GH85 family endohexosaminidase C-terminal domain-containing protein n=1 Tax=Clostridium estertheticum TaxID=238834 RepID=UPI0013E91BE7|nr:hypothetical protein [Clostridium estertheticum]MBZ9686691.1 hypothetical protein [Clostridium estertheticum]